MTETRLFKTDCERQQDRQRNQCPELLQARFKARQGDSYLIEILFPCDQQRRCCSQARQDCGNDRVAVPNINENLIRVEEVVDRHGVEAGIELLEKIKFCYQTKKLERPEQE